MRTPKMLFVTLCLVGLCVSYRSQSTCYYFSDPGEILILPQNDIPDDAPRGPIFNPFTAYLQNNQVVLESSENCGLVAVEIASTTGFYYSTVFDTEDGYIVMPISGNVGSYTLTLTMSSGDVFVGSFII